MNTLFGSALTLAKAGTAADSAEKMKDTTGVNPWGLHFETAGRKGCFVWGWFTRLGMREEV